jgi:hypothetical protein
MSIPRNWKTNNLLFKNNSITLSAVMLSGVVFIGQY